MFICLLVCQARQPFMDLEQALGEVSDPHFDRLKGGRLGYLGTGGEVQMMKGEWRVGETNRGLLRRLTSRDCKCKISWGQNL